jgi:hypothetical protein
MKIENKSIYTTPEWLGRASVETPRSASMLPRGTADLVEAGFLRQSQGAGKWLGETFERALNRASDRWAKNGAGNRT